MVSVEREGRTYNFSFDIDEAIALEESDGYNVFDGLDGLLTAKGNLSLSGVNRMCKAVLGHPVKELLDDGFILTDLVGEDGLILSVLRESGFISARKDGDTSPDTAPSEPEGASESASQSSEYQ